jgi:hypothetical protein
MTPQVRSLIYSYRPLETQSSEQELVYNIPYQLQSLFARLQIQVDEKAIDTKALTKSFHWTSAESF